MSDSCWRTISTISFVCLPLRACFLVVFLQQWPKPGTGLMSLLLTGGGCNTSLGGLVRHTGRAAALIRIPVIPEIQQSESGKRRNGSASLVNSSQPSLYVTRNSSWLVCVFFYQRVQGEQDWIHWGSSQGRWAHCERGHKLVKFSVSDSDC